MPILLLLVVAVCLIVFVPLAAIWAINTLVVPLIPSLVLIPFTLETWAAMFVILWLFRGNVNVKNTVKTSKF